MELIKESRDLIAFMTCFRFMWTTILAQSAINLVAQFLKIVLKILALYLRDQAKPFLNNVRVEKQNVNYNN